jgi:chemotaxis family two-component system response regulator Rcp1
MKAADQVPRAAEILLVEDSPTDALLAQEALLSSRVCNNLYKVTDGVEAMAFLRREGKYGNVPRPDLILLDLSLPKKEGWEVLKEIKSEDTLKRIPVIALTTAKNDADIRRAYGDHANCYIAKPVNFIKFAEAVRNMANFWLAVVTLPGKV